MKAITPAPKPVAHFIAAVATSAVVGGVLLVAPKPAEAACASDPTKPVCGPVQPPAPIPGPTPSPSPAPVPPVINNNNNPVANGGQGGLGGQGGQGGAATSGAAAAANSNSAATATNKTNVAVGVESTNNNKNTANGGNALSVSEGGTGIGLGGNAQGGNAQGGNAQGGNSGGNTFSTTSTYQAAASGATAYATGTAASGKCDKSLGGWAFGAQALAWGASVSRNSGTEYEMKEMTFTDADGKTRTELRNPCAADQAGFMQIAAGQAPGATKGEKKLAVTIGREMSPAIDNAVRRVGKDKAELAFLFEDEANPPAPPAAPPVAPSQNVYVTNIQDKTGQTSTTFTCPNGTKLVVGKDGRPVLDAAGGHTCTPH